MHMTLQEAIKHARDNPKDWVRPGPWVGSGQAICYREDTREVVIVPDFYGGRRWYPRVVELLAEWEVVSPDVVNGEYQKAMR